MIRSDSKLGFLYFVCLLYGINSSCDKPVFSSSPLFSALPPCSRFIKYHRNILSRCQHGEKEKNQKGCLEDFSLYFLPSQDSFIPKTFLTVKHYNLLHRSAAMFLNIRTRNLVCLQSFQDFFMLLLNILYLNCCQLSHAHSFNTLKSKPEISTMKRHLKLGKLCRGMKRLPHTLPDVSVY